MNNKIQTPERFDDTGRNLILNRTVTDLEKIINSHDPEIHGTICQEVWDRLDQMALEIEARSAATQVRVKPLDWSRVVEDIGEAAQGLHVTCYANDDGYWYLWVNGQRILKGYTENLSEAKLAAETEYQKITRAPALEKGVK